MIWRKRRSDALSVGNAEVDGIGVEGDGLGHGGDQVAVAQLGDRDPDPVADVLQYRRRGKSDAVPQRLAVCVESAAEEGSGPGSIFVPGREESAVGERYDRGLR